MCCRETWMKQKDVILSKCYDPDGEMLVDDEKLSQMTVSMEEPQECNCHKCGL